MNFDKICAYILLISIFLLPNCGRKQKDIFSFDPEPEIKVNKLDLPAVRGLSVAKTKDGILLSWFDLFGKKNNPKINLLQKNFVGYDVFKLTKKMFIPKTPINKSPLIETRFIDNSKNYATKLKSQSFYLIQPVFKFNDQIIKGPSSQIVADK